MELGRAKKQVIEAGKELVERGLIARTWGNVSCRIDGDSFVITPSGRDYMSLEPSDIVQVSMPDLTYDGTVKPSSEKGAHAQVYQLKPEANFVIHTHQENASILSACNIKKAPIDTKYETLSGEVLITGYGLPSTKNLTGKIGEALERTKSQGLILRNHGALCYGVDYGDTFKAAVELEAASLAYIMRRYRKISNEKKTPVDMLSIFDYVLKKNHQSFISKRAGASIKDIKGYSNHKVIDHSAVLYAASLAQTVRPMVDDFAQIIGLQVRTVANEDKAINRALKKSAAVLVPGVGAVCVGNNEDDLNAVEMILIKTCKAHMCAQLFGQVKAINAVESKLMNMVYKLKYAKQK